MLFQGPMLLRRPTPPRQRIPRRLQAPESPPAITTPPLGGGDNERAVTAWERSYRAAVVAMDIVIVLFAVTVAAASGMSGAVVVDPGLAPLTATATLTALGARGAWRITVLGHGREEFRRLGLGLVTAAVAVALISPTFDPWDARPWLFAVFPAIGVLTLLSRFLLRGALYRARRSGRCVLPVLAVGNPAAIRDLIARTRAHLETGWYVEAACVVAPDGQRCSEEIDGVTVMAGPDRIAELVRLGGYRVVAVTPDDSWTPDRLQRLTWSLEGSGAELVVTPALLDVEASKVSVRSALGMPLLTVHPARFTGWRHGVKAVVDRIGAAVLLVLFAPVLVAIAAAIKLDSPGPVFYRQLRAERDGRYFRMWKFRTMHVGAEDLLDELATRNESDGPLFKIRDDPRVTRLGRVLRRFSLDELPQLFNVLTGSMSLVGPRPPLPAETRQYSTEIGRRLLVKPGMTGLGQVSGRSDLSWAESIRLDQRYVDNWSLTLDVVILWKTVRAVLTGEGAY